MLRARFGTDQQTTPLWQEAYSYDSSGNVASIGTKTYAYDADSRIVWARNSSVAPPVLPLPYQEFAYDPVNRREI